jgi:RimJ/RimL family protein N-acetyltransferase
MKVTICKPRTLAEVHEHEGIVHALWDEGGRTRAFLFPGKAGYPSTRLMYLKVHTAFYLRYLILCNGETVGFMGVSLYPMNRMAYVGYGVLKPYRGRGIMTTALRELVKRLSKKTSLDMIKANVEPQNKASIAVLKSAGFVLTGYSYRLILSREHATAQAA